MSRSARDKMADLVRARGEIGNLLARPDAAPHALGGVGEPAHRLGDRVGERQRQHQHHRREHQEEAQRSPSAPSDHAVDVAALGRELKRAAGRHHVLDRHGDRDDRLALVVDAHQQIAFCPAAPPATSGIVLPLVAHGSSGRGAAEVGEEAAQAGDDPIGKAAPVRRVGQVGAHDGAARRERARVEQKPAVAVVDARARVGRRDQPMQERARPAPD